MAYTWDKKTARYRDATGKFVARETVYQSVNDYINGSTDAINQLARMVSGGEINAADWYSLMRSEIKDAYIASYTAGIGGRSQMTQADWGRIGRMVRDQYAYLDRFKNDVQNGNLTEAQIAARSQMYINSARQAYEKSAQLSAKKAGYDEELWVVDPDAEHCDDCVIYAGQGWQPIGTFPEPGDGTTECLTNCKCLKQFRNSETGEIYE